MIIYFAGHRVGFLDPIKRKLPRYALFTFNDLSDYGHGEQKKLFRLLVKQRRKKVKR